MKVLKRCKQCNKLFELRGNGSLLCEICTKVYTRSRRERAKDTYLNNLQTPLADFLPRIIVDRIYRMLSTRGNDNWQKKYVRLQIQIKTIRKLSISKPPLKYWENLGGKSGKYVSIQASLNKCLTVWGEKYRSMTMLLKSRRKSMITLQQIRNQFQKQNFKCAITGEQLTPENASADHRIPIAKGGANTIDNIQMVTKM